MPLEILRTVNDSRMPPFWRPMTTHWKTWMRWREPSRQSAVLFVVLAVAILLAVLVSGWLIPKMNDLRLAQRAGEATFQRLHGWSMGLMSLETLLLLVVGAILPRQTR